MTSPVWKNSPPTLTPCLFLQIIHFRKGNFIKMKILTQSKTEALFSDNVNKEAQGT